VAHLWCRELLLQVLPAFGAAVAPVDFRLMLPLVRAVLAVLVSSSSPNTAVLEVVAVLVLLHGPDGHGIMINPDNVASMHAAIPGEKNKNISEKVNCFINTADGKFVSVVETCEQVHELFRQSEQPR
jgi:hypothetical protein